MISGKVTDEREAVIAISVEGDRDREGDLSAVIDTGFNGYLTLPRATINRLGLLSHGVRRAEIADGGSIILEIYRVNVIWDGASRTVQALCSEGSPLVGMAMLQGYRVTLDVRPSGTVSIESLA